MINLTPVASSKVKEIMNMQSPVPVALRVAVVGGGCSGFQYHMAFENQTSDADQVFDFDGLKVALQNEQESFTAAAEATKDQEITHRQQKVQQITDAIAAKQKEISQLQQQLSQMSTDLVEAQGKIQRAESQFTIAAQRRAVEIDQEKAKYVTLLQG